MSLRGHKTPAINRYMQRRLISLNRICQQSAMAELKVPSADGQPKMYPEKIERIVTDISQLNLLEVAQLNELLKSTLNIADAPMMAMSPAAASPPPDEDEQEAAVSTKVQTSFTLKLTAFDAAKKVPLIKEIKAAVEGMNLVQAKKFVESAPATLKENVSKDEAEKLKELLTAAGGTCEIL